MAGSAKAVEARTEKARPKISLVVFMMCLQFGSGELSSRYGGNVTELVIIKKLIGLLPTIAKNDSKSHRPFFGPFSGEWLFLVHFLKKFVINTLDKLKNK